MKKIDDRLNDLEYRIHELREEIEVNYEHMTMILQLLRKKFPEEFMSGPGFHLKAQQNE
jgi:hypothetical protein